MRNQRAVVVEQLDALLHEARENCLEVVVVDDASSDGTADLVTDWIERASAGEVRLVRRRRRGGPNASRNDGAAAATSDFLLFCDGDDVVVEGWAAAMLAARAERVVLGGALSDLATRDRSPDLDRWPVPAQAWGHAYAYGGNMATTRAVVDEVGGFDERIFAGGTEFDFCFRAARDHGIPTVGVPGALVWYRLPVRWSARFAQEVRRERGRCYLRRKFGAAVVQGRSASEWLTDWLRLVRLVVLMPFDAASRRGAARLAASLFGRMWWSVRFRVVFL